MGSGMRKAKAMIRNLVLAGLMAASALSTVAHAQDEGRRTWGGTRGGERSQPRGDAGAVQGNNGNNWRAREQSAAPQQVQQPQRQPRYVDRPQSGDAPRGRSQPSADWQARMQQRQAEQQARQQAPAQSAANRQDRRNWRNDTVEVRKDRPDMRGGVENGNADWRARADAQRDARNDGEDRRQDWRRNGRDDNRPIWNRDDNRRDRDNRTNADGRDWNRDRDRNRADNRNWSNQRPSYGFNGRLDDRQRWGSQPRWDNNWRQDRRYDWQRYRSQYRNVYHMGRYYAPRGWSYGYRPFSSGWYMDSMFYSDSYWLDDPYEYRLPPAYGSMRWIRYYDDALLVDIRDGYVVDVIRNFFW